MIEENKTVDVALGAKLEPLIRSAGYGLYVPKTLKLTFYNFPSKTCMAAEPPPVIAS